MQMLNNPLAFSNPATDPRLAGLRAALAGQAMSTKAKEATPPPRPVVNVSGGNSADQALAKALASAGMDSSPIETPLELGGRLAQVWSGNRLERDFQDKERDKYKGLAETLAGVTDPGEAARILIGSGDPSLMKAGIEFRMNPPKTAQDEYGFITQPDGTVLKTNKRTGAAEPAYQGVPKSEYRPITAEERIAANIPETDKTPYQIGRDGKISAIGSPSTVVNTNVDMKGESAEAAERGKAIPKHYAKIAEDLPAADALAQSVDQIGSLLEGTDTGTKPAFLEFVRKNTGIAIGEQADKRQALESMVDYLTPRMRVPGSGATSDMEMKTFKNSLPTLMGTPGGNAIIMGTMKGLAERRVAMARIAEDYLVGEKTAQEAAAAMRALPDPFAQFKAATAGKARADQAAGKPAPTPDTPPQGIDAGVWKYMTPEERALWK